MNAPFVCGIDVGTSAVRVVVSDRSGDVRGTGACDLPAVRADGPRREQDPEAWWRAVAAAVRTAVADVEASSIGVVAVDATSGTIVAVDAGLQPLGPGLMYNDARAAGYAERVNDAAGDFVERHGYAFEDSFALPRLLWLRDHEPGFERVRTILHQGDFINARLVGEVPPTDWSTALKSGCDLFESRWGGFIEARLGFPLEKLPQRVVAPGTPIGAVCPRAADATGLAAGTSVAAGASDGTAALLASGAGRVGDFNSALGTTLVLKGITERPLRDPDGVVYCHRHPDGPWLPGGASNVGGVALDREADLAALDAEAAALLPCPVLAYPLGDAREERFPFRRAGIESFMSPRPVGAGQRHAALLQAIAFVERWCYETLESLGARIERVFSTGGGSRSDVWNRLRADVLARPLSLPAHPESAWGAAILAASDGFGSVAAACEAMVRVERCIEPGGRDFGPLYGRFRDECRRRWSIG